jgi:hypothetical protein
MLRLGRLQSRQHDNVHILSRVTQKIRVRRVIIKIKSGVKAAPLGDG